MRIWHLIKLGHLIRVNRHITRGMFDTSKGWLFTCECGKAWAR